MDPAYMLKSSIISDATATMRTGNPFIDMFITFAVVSIIGYIFNSNPLSRIYTWIKLHMPSISAGPVDGHVTYEINVKENLYTLICTKTYGITSHIYDAVLIYLHKNNITGMSNIAELKKLSEVTGTLESARTSTTLQVMPKTKVSGVGKFENIKIEFTVTREPSDDKKSTEKNTDVVNKTLTLTSFTNATLINEFIKYCLDEYYIMTYNRPRPTHGKRNVLVCTPLNPKKKYYEYVSYPSKRFSNIFTKHKSTIVNHLEQLSSGYINCVKLLLHGPPGTGKTSFIKAMSAELNRDIIMVKLSEVQSYQDLLTIMTQEYECWDSILSENKHKIIVFEDVTFDAKVVTTCTDSDNDSNCVNTNRIHGIDIDRSVSKSNAIPNSQLSDAALAEILKQTKQTEIIPEHEKRITVYDILQILDGVIELKDLIVVMTTNHRNRMDPTIVRSGRITLDLELGNIDSESAREMVAYYFNLDGSKKHHCSNEVDFNKIALTYTCGMLAPCKLENICIHASCLNEVNYMIAAMCLN
jgi:hypothetical protein